MKLNRFVILLVLAAVALVSIFVIRSSGSTGELGPTAKAADFNLFFDLHSTDQSQISDTLSEIKRGWHPGSVAMLLEMFHLAKFHKTKQQIADCLEEKTGEKYGINGKKWQRWIWNQDYTPHPEYPKFQSKLYAHVDDRFPEYFEHTEGALIRLDEIKWGGVKRDEIPPLDNPPMVEGSGPEASYLGDSNEVFGISINGDHRCYPKRILAWHEMFKDTIGGVPVCGVY